MVGTCETKLLVIRGNSGSGKSTIARQLRHRHGRGCALVEQDHLRRILLRERDKPGGLAPALIEQNVRFCLDHGYHVVLDGILHSSRYRDMLTRLRDAHRGTSVFCYLDVSLSETLRRHATRPQASEFTEQDMTGWYSPGDVLGWTGEVIIGETSLVEDTIATLVAAAGLSQTGRDTDLLPAAPRQSPGRSYE
ncbi:kinase [Plantactinospora siamensis]|uniref:Kinase n=1 Tax=Plantactinospora siamensis TaxID=555372 RepID=A0ABV6P4W3_9ACTN